MIKEVEFTTSVDRKLSDARAHVQNLELARLMEVAERVHDKIKVGWWGVMNAYDEVEFVSPDFSKLAVFDAEEEWYPIIEILGDRIGPSDRWSDERIDRWIEHRSKLKAEGKFF